MGFFDKKRKRREGDFYIDMDEYFGDMQAMMDQLMKGFASNDDFFKTARTNPVRMGFSIKFNQNGRPIIREFGNVRRSEGKPVLSDRREPLVDVNYSDKDVTITAELPGVQKREIKAKAGKDSLAIDVENKDRPYFKEIALERKVEPKSMKSEFKNGILEITIKRK